MAEDAFENYLGDINKPYLRGDAGEHTHRPGSAGLVVVSYVVWRQSWPLRRWEKVSNNGSCE